MSVEAVNEGGVMEVVSSEPVADVVSEKNIVKVIHRLIELAKQQENLPVVVSQHYLL